MLSVIILTLNSLKFIRPCLDPIFAQNYKNFEVIVVDNGSKDSTVSFIKENFSKIILIENRENLGACKARNQGIEVARGRWILTLDCDIILEKDFLNKIIKFAKESEESVGILQPKILRGDRKTIYSCGIYLSKLRRFYDIGKRRPNNGKFNKMRYIFGACSAAALYKRQMLEEIKEQTGYFDERFFFLAEDVDLSWRAQKKGWRTLYCPEAICYHLGNSSNTSKQMRQYLCFRNRYYSIIKNEGIKNYFKKFFPFLFYDFPRLLYLLFTNRYIFKDLN